MKSVIYTTACAVLVLAISACQGETQNKRSPQPRPEVRALKNVKTAFDLVKDQTSAEIKFVKIYKDALDKEYILKTSLISQTPFPSWNGMQTRVIAFKRSGNSVYMLEAGDGHSLTTELPVKLILAELPIVEEQADHLVIDFNEGLSKIFIEADWHASDFPSSESAHWMAVPVESSFIDSATVDENFFTFEQVAQIHKIDQYNNGIYETVRAKFHLSPYHPSPSFKPVVASDFKNVGYFEAKPRLPISSGNELRWASKWDESKTITFAISDNTPDEVKEAVRKGILYWNHHFGKDIIKVIDAPKGVTAPSYKYNMVQWIDFDDAGFAYADAQLDPRTGEILHAQVFMTSAFLNGTVPNIQFEKLTKSNQTKIGLKNFASTALCQRQEKHEDYLVNLYNLKSTLNKDDYLRMASYYITEVIAHEIGHTLGLRHNFAGSIASNIKNEDRSDLFTQLLNNENITPSVKPTSTVMDYHDFTESVLAGYKTENAPDLFDYDSVAIKHLYGGQQVPDNAPLFCTDSHAYAAQYLDCKMWDYGNDYVAYKFDKQEKLSKGVVGYVVQALIAAKYPPKGYSKKTFAEVMPTPQTLGFFAAFATGRTLEIYNQQAELLQVTRSFESDADIFDSEISQATTGYIDSRVVSKGYGDRPLGNLDRDWASEIVSDFAKVAQNNFEGYLGGMGQEVEFSDAEMQEIFELLKKSTLNLNHHYLLNLADILTNEAVDFKESASLTKIEGQILNLSKQIVFSQSEDENDGISVILTKLGETKTYAVTLPKFAFPADLRQKFALALISHVSSDDSLLYQEKRAAKEEFRKLLSETIGFSIDEVDMNGLPNEATKWLLDNKKIASFLAQ